MADTIIPFDQMATLDNPVFKAAGIAPAPEPAAIPFDQIQSAPPQTIDVSQISNVDSFPRRTTDDLQKDDTFDPRKYFADNPDVAKDPAQLQKLIDVYRARREKGVTLGAVGEAVKAAPGTAVKFAKGLGTLANNVFEFSGLQPAFNAAASVIIGDAFDTKRANALRQESENRARQAYSEFQAGTELSATGLSDLARTGARKIFGKPVKDLSNQELLAQLSEDAAFQNQLREVQSGRGESLKNAGLDADTLAKEGIHLDSNAIENLSLVDPATVIATAGLFKVVGTGGKILATAASEAGAAKAATALNNLATQTAGKAVQGLGKAVTAAGEKAAGAVGAIPTPLAEAGGAVGGALTSGNVEGAYVGAKAARGLQSGIVKAGQAAANVGESITNLGEQITGQAPISAGVQKLANFANTYGRPITGAVKGAAVGTAVAAPLALLADENQTAGGILSGGIALGGVAGGLHGTFGAVTDAAANRYFGAHEKLLPPVNSPAYGLDPALDAAHQSAMQALPIRERNLINNFREGTRNVGGEFYALNEAEYSRQVAEAYKRETGKDISPDLLKKYADTHAQFSEYRPDANGNVRKVVLLNADAQGLLHDAGHLFDASLSPEVADSLRQAVQQTFTPEQLADAQARYERRLGEKITPDRAMDEFIAEQFNALFHNVPLNEMTAPPSLLGKFTDTIAKGAEALGIDLTGGKVTPSLGNPLSVGMRELFKNAASEIVKANETNPNSNPPPTAPAGPAPAGPAPTPVPAAPAAPRPAVRNIRVTRAQQDAFAKRAAETGVTEAKANAAGEPETAARVKEISDSMEAGNPVLEIEHLGITNEGSPAAPTGRTARRGEQAAGYAELEAIRADNRANAPESIVNQHQKTFVPVRWTNQGGTPTLIAMSLDKVISNIHQIVADAADKNSSRLIPYPSENGKLTEAGWNKAIADAQAYAENQSNGFRGDGRQLVRPTEDLGFSIPAENPDYKPQLLGEAEANFQNLIQGLATPETAREQKGLTPGNIKGQVLAEANQRPTLTPSQIKPKNLTKQEFKSFPGRSLKEVNPLRNELAKAGVDVRDLIEVTERIRAKDIASVKPRPDLNFKAPVTDIIRGGFLPGESVDDLADRIRATDAVGWQKLTTDMGGLTNAAYKLGQGLKDVSDVQKLRQYEAEFQAQYDAAKKAGDFDTMFPAATKKQFFTEAIETATGEKPGKYNTIARVLGPDWKPPFPQESAGSKFLPKPEPATVEKFKDASPYVKDEAGNPKVFFHGSFKSEELVDSGAWDISKSYKRSLFGPGFYFTDSPKAAGGPYLKNKVREFFGLEPLGYATKPTGHHLPFGIPESGSKAPPSPGVVAAFLDLKNPFDIEKTYSPKEVQEIAKNVDPFNKQRWIPELAAPWEALQKTGGTGGQIFQTLKEHALYTESPGAEQSRQGQNSYGEKLTKDWLEKSGFDGVTYLGGVRRAGVGLHSVVAAWHPEQIINAFDQGGTPGKFSSPKNVSPDEIKFLPRTDAGKKLADEGFDFRISGQPGTRGVTVLKDGVAVGEFQSAQRTPDVAEISGVGLLPKFRGSGAAEAAYRELLTQLKEDGAKKVEGTVVAPQPLAIRRKIFGGFDKLELNGKPVNINDALQAANEIKTSRELLNIEAVNEIKPEMQFLPGEETDQARRSGLLPDKAPPRTPSQPIRDLAAAYAETAGINYKPDSTYAPVDPKLGRKIADFYDAAKSNPEDPKVKASYDALITETQAQAKQILDAGYTIEPYIGDGEPYKSSADMVADVRDNKHLYFLQTDKAITGGTGTDNPMLEQSTVVPGQRVNDVFRWVHDFFGHAKEGYQFGPRGEFNAWRAHSEMYSPEAQGALAAETLAQNSWVNYGKHLEGKDVPPTERPFAEQKNVVVPQSLIDEAKAVAASGTANFLPKQKEIPPEDVQRLKNTYIADMGQYPGLIIQVPSERIQAFLKTLTPDDLLRPNAISTQVKLRVVSPNGKAKEFGPFYASRGSDRVIRDLEQAVGIKREVGQSDVEFFRSENFTSPLTSDEAAKAMGQTLVQGRDVLGPAWLFRDGKAIEGDSGMYHDDAVDGLNAAGTVDARSPEQFQAETGAVRLGTFSSARHISDYGDATLGISLSRKMSGAQRTEILELLKGEVKEGNPHFSEIAVDIIKADGSIYAGRTFNYPSQRGMLARFLNDPFSEEFAAAKTGEKFLPREDVQFLPKKNAQENKALEFPAYVVPAPQNRGLERTVDTGGATREFWLNSKTGKVILAPDGHEEAANATVLLDEPAIRDSGDLAAVYDAMQSRGWVRGVIEPHGATNPSIFLNGAADVVLSAPARRTMEDIAFKNDRPVLLNDRSTDIGPAAEPAGGLYLPKKVKRDEEGRPLTRDGLIDYERLYKEKIAAEKKQQREEANKPTKNYDIPNNQTELSPKGLTGWILPDKKFVPLETQYHEQYLADNADKLNAQFGTDFSNEANVDSRLAALNAGFTRLRYEANRGALHIETAAKNWAAARKQILDRVLEAEGSIDNLIVSLLDENGKVVDSINERLFNLDGPEKLNKIEEALDSLRARGSRYLPTSKNSFPEDRVEDVNRWPKFNQLVGLWLSPDGEFFDARPDHYRSAEKFIVPETVGNKEDPRDAAYKKGWVRVNLDGSGRDTGDGQILIEGAKPNRTQKQALEDAAFSQSLPVKDDNGQEVIENPNPESKFLPKEQSLPGLKAAVEDDKTKLAENAIARAKNEFPEARLPVYARDDQGNVRLNWEGAPLTVPVDYDLSNTPLAKEAAKGLKGPEREKAIAAALGDKLVREYKSAVKNPAIEAGSKWYSTARTRLKKLLGDDAKFFAELLGATSPQTGVETNFKYAVEAYNQFKAGAYDEILAKYREGKKAWADADIDEFLRDTKIENPTRGQFLDWWVKKNNLIPLQSNGKRFGLHSRAVLRVLDRSWLSEVKGPKTPNFTGNLTGETFEATIDVWAARALHRLANEGNTKRWRILPGNETGVTDPDFYLGQAAYRHAAEKLGIKPDALQAVLWFAEKDYWEKKGWTKAVGATKSDFNSLLGETERTPEGKLTPKKRQKTLEL
jgi:hypothetical protein